MEIQARKVTAAISINGYLSLALDQYNHLLVHNYRTETNIDLGPFTQQRAKKISEYLQRLAIHTPEK